MPTKHFAALVMISAVACIPLAAQDTSALRRFGGTWEARVRGEVVCTIKLTAVEKISGSVNACALNFNEEGDLIQPESSGRANQSSPILNTRLQKDVLSFDVKDDGDTEPIKFEMKLRDDGQADLRLIDAPAPVKPVRFEKQ